MTKYNPCIQQTFGTLLIAGMLASCYANLNPSNRLESIAYPQVELEQSRRIIISGTSTTLETFRNMNALEYSHHEYFETEVTAFFQQLSSNQVKLGDTFEKILFDNIWDLYQS